MSLRPFYVYEDVIVWVLSLLSASNNWPHICLTDVMWPISDDIWNNCMKITRRSCFLFYFWAFQIFCDWKFCAIFKKTFVNDHYFIPWKTYLLFFFKKCPPPFYFSPWGNEFFPVNIHDCPLSFLDLEWVAWPCGFCQFDFMCSNSGINQRGYVLSVGGLFLCLFIISSFPFDGYSLPRNACYSAVPCNWPSEPFNGV